MKKIMNVLCILLLALVFFNCPVPGKDGKDGFNGKDSFILLENSIVLYEGDCSSDYIELDVANISGLFEGEAKVGLKITNISNEFNDCSYNFIYVNFAFEQYSGFTYPYWVYLWNINDYTKIELFTNDNGILYFRTFWYYNKNSKVKIELISYMK